MQLFVDTADREEVRRWQRYGVVDGVTTNPTIILGQGWPALRPGIVDLARLIEPRPLSVEVFATETDDILAQARAFAGWADNVVIKVPVTSEHGEPYLDVICELQRDGIRVNCTACMSFCQAMLGAKAGATYVSLLVGRINDEGGNGIEVVRHTCWWLRTWAYSTQVIAGSIRGPGDVQALAQAGVDVVTVPPPILHKLADHRYSRATAAQFLQDGQQSFGARTGTEIAV